VYQLRDNWGALSKVGVLIWGVTVVREVMKVKKQNTGNEFVTHRPILRIIRFFPMSCPADFSKGTHHAVAVNQTRTNTKALL